MAHQIIGVDLGAYSVKAIVLATKPKLQWLTYDEERVVLDPRASADAANAAAPGEAQAADEPQEGQAQDQAAADDASQQHEEEPAPAVEHEEDELKRQLEPWAAALERLMARMGHHFAENLVTFMPDQKALTVQIGELPFNERKDLLKILPNMLADRLPLPLDKIVYEFRILGDEQRKYEALVGFAKRDDLRKTIDELEAAKVDPKVLTLPEWGLELVATSAVEQAQEKTFALIDLGHEHTRVLVMQRGKPLMARTIKFGGRQLDLSLSQRFKISEEEAQKVKHHSGAILKPSETQDPSLMAMSEAISRAFMPMIRDLRRTFQALYAKDRVELETIYVCGGTSQLRHLTRFFGEEFGVPVEPLPLTRLELGAELDQPTRSSLVMAYAMAMALAEEFKGRSLNLRTGAFAYRGRSSYVRGQLIKYAVLAGVLFACLLSALWMQQRDLNARRDAMRASVGKETKRVLGTSVYDKKTLEKFLDAEGDAKTSIAPKMSAYQLTYEIVSRIEDGTKLELQRFDIDASRNLIQIYGTTSTPQAVDKLVSDLEQLRCLKEIRKDKLKVKNENEASFELQITSGCS